MPRVRSTIRRLMAAVAVVALVLGAETALYRHANRRVPDLPRRRRRVIEGWLLLNFLPVLVAGGAWAIRIGRRIARLPVAPDPHEPA